jgi:hypothetical protein
MNCQPPQTPSESITTPFPAGRSTERSLKRNGVVLAKGDGKDDRGKHDGAGCKGQTKDLIRQREVPEADDKIIVDGDRFTRERLTHMPAHTLEHPPESGHNVLVEVGLFHTQVVAYSLMLKMASERRDTNSKS